MFLTLLYAAIALIAYAYHIKAYFEEIENVNIMLPLASAIFWPIFYVYFLYKKYSKQDSGEES